MYIYFPLIFILFLPYMYSKMNPRRLFAVMGVIAFGGIFSLESLAWTMDLLSSSSQNLSESTSVLSRSYNPLLLSGMIEFPIVDALLARTESQFFKDILTFFLPSSGIVFGFTIMAFGIIGLLNISNKKIQIPIILILFYWIGPFHYMLSELFGNPFSSETSIRINLTLYIIFSLLTIYTVENNFHLARNKIVKKIISIFLLLTLFQFALIFFKGVTEGAVIIWAAGIVYMLSMLSLFLYLKNNKRLFLVFSLLVLPLSGGFGVTGMTTFKYNSTSQGASAIKEYMEYISKDDVLLFAKKRQSKNDLHPNMFMPFKARVVNAYMTPNNKNFSQLFWYQYLTYKDNEDDILENIDRFIRYYDMLDSIVINDNQLTSASINYIKLLGVTRLITTADVNLDNTYNLLYENNGVKIYEVPNTKSYHSVCKQNSFNNIYEILKKDIDINNYFYMQKNNSKDMGYCNGNLKVINFSINNKMSQVEFSTQGVGRRIITTNITYYDNFKEIGGVKGSRLDVFKCNGAFLCIDVVSRDVFKKDFIVRYTKPGIKSLLKKW
jgi:hypothetical protein